MHESDAQVAEAKENLARVTDDVELRLQIAYNKLQRTREMVQVSEELYALRAESSRVIAQQLQKGEALQSQSRTRSRRSTMPRPCFSSRSSITFRPATK